MTLDDLRDRFPLIGFAVYALEPRGAVTVEIHKPDGSYGSVQAWTVADAVAAAGQALGLVEEPAPAAEAEPEENIFD